MKGSRIIVPKSLRKEMKNIIHQGHMGIEGCRRRARQSLYWPLMNKDIAEMISRCDVCTTYRNKLPKQELIHHEIPTNPWTKLGTDLFSLKGKEYLVVIDYTSKFVIVAHLERTDSSCVITKLKNMFSVHGIPKELFSDGGPQFTSSQFKHFQKEWDFHHTRSSPHYPQSNGQVERTVQTVKRALRKALESGEDPYLALLTINTTPDISGKSPAEKLFGRHTRSQIPSMRTSRSPTEETARNNGQLSPGAPVRIRYDTDKSWSRRGTIVRKRAEPRSYDILNEKGNTVRVNERHILPDSSTSSSSNISVKLEDDILDNILSTDTEGRETAQTVPDSVVHLTADTPTTTPAIRSADTTTTTRSGRSIRRPLRYR